MGRLYEQYLAGARDLSSLNESLLVEGFLADMQTRIMQLGGKAVTLFKKHPAIFTAIVLTAAAIAAGIYRPKSAEETMKRMQNGVMPRSQDIANLQKYVEDNKQDPKAFNKVFNSMVDLSSKVDKSYVDDEGYMHNFNPVTMDKATYVSNILSFMNDKPDEAWGILKKQPNFKALAKPSKDPDTFFKVAAGTKNPYYTQNPHTKTGDAVKGYWWELEQVLKDKPAALPSLIPDNQLIAFAKKHNLVYGRDRHNGPVIAKNKAALDKVINANSQRELGLALGYTDVWTKEK